MVNCGAAHAVFARDVLGGATVASESQESAWQAVMRGPVKVLGTGKSLVDLQRKFAEQAEASARQMVKKQAENAGNQGKLVEQANLLHKAGATTEARSTMLWRGALDVLRMPSERISSRWLGAEALMLASAPYQPRRILLRICSWLR